jgi:hypothetical protein
VEATKLTPTPTTVAVPVLRLRGYRPEDLHVPFAAAPRFDHFGRDHVDEDFREKPSFGVAFEVIGRLVPAEVRVQHQRQEQIVPVVHDDELSAGALLRGVVDQIFLSAVGADIALQGEVAGDDFLDRDFLVPAVAAVFLFAARFGHLFGAAQRAPRFHDRLTRHGSIYN